MPLIVDHDERRVSYARSAWAVIAERGLVGTTMRDLASAAGVTTGALTHYFESKQQLVEHALEQLAHDTLQRTAEVEIKTRAHLSELILLALPTDEAGHTEWKVWIALWSECARGNPTALSLNADFEARWNSVLTNAVAAVGHQNPADGAERLALTINGAGIGACLDPSRWPPQRLGQLATDIAGDL